MGAHRPNKRFRHLSKLLKPHGYYIQPIGKTGHLGVYDQQNRKILVMAGSPKNVDNCERYVLIRLRKRGLLPDIL